jgi:hypothetical protein
MRPIARMLIVMMTTPPNSSNRAPGRLYSPRRFNKQSRARFTANRTAELIRHLGREPSYPERIIIARVVAIEFDLRRYDAALDRGEELSGHALRARLAAETRLRLDLAALGTQPAKPKGPSLAEHMARLAAEAEAAA